MLTLFTDIAAQIMMDVADLDGDGKMTMQRLKTLRTIMILTVTISMSTTVL